MIHTQHVICHNIFHFNMQCTLYTHVHGTCIVKHNIIGYMMTQNIKLSLSNTLTVSMVSDIYSWHDLQQTVDKNQSCSSADRTLRTHFEAFGTFVIQDPGVTVGLIDTVRAIWEPVTDTGQTDTGQVSTGQLSGQTGDRRLKGVGWGGVGVSNVQRKLQNYMYMM